MMDAESYTRALEAAYQRMWQVWSANGWNPRQ
jgi:predicted O-linked N-acetylglucosamine transferase (SPINDLY family)